MSGHSSSVQLLRSRSPVLGPQPERRKAGFSFSSFSKLFFFPCAMPFVEDPVHLSKSRLKSDLVAHNVELPPAASKKQVYVELHLKHVDQRHAADFSSDEEEDREQNGAVQNEDAEVIDPSRLTDDDLKAALLQHGVKAGPIVASTRALYEKKLRNLLQSDGVEEEKAVLYSDSEEEEEEEEMEVENGDEEEKESASEQEETLENPDQAQQECTELPQEPGKEILKDIFPDTRTTPTGIYVTCRKPIKGAAQRPVQYAHPETPVSPATFQSQEVERRLVPLHIRMVVFLLLACVLYLIYLSVEDSGSALDVLNSLSLGSESSDEGQELPSDT